MSVLFGPKEFMKELLYRYCLLHHKIQIFVQLLGPVMYRNPGGIPGVYRVGKNTTLFPGSKCIKVATNKKCNVTNKCLTLRKHTPDLRAHNIVAQENHETNPGHYFLHANIGRPQLVLHHPKQEIGHLHSCFYKNGSVALHSFVLPDSLRHLSTSAYKSDHNNVVIDMLAPKSAAATQTDMVPGKGRPPEPPTDCCGAGCVDCVWIPHIRDLMDYYPAEQGILKAKQTIQSISDPQMRLFMKIELGL